MKLLLKTNRYYIVIALAMLIIGSFVIAFRIIELTDSEINGHLLIEKDLIDHQLVLQPNLRDEPFVIGDKIEVFPIDSFRTFVVKLTDTLVYDKYEKKKVPVRILSYEKEINKKGYRINIQKRLTEDEDVLIRAGVTIAIMALAVVFGFYFLNKWFSEEVWHPFYNALRTLRIFDVSKTGKLLFSRSEIDEFNDLNSAITKLTTKISDDYHNLKEFTENTSHEIQTPLAIIRSKLEMLIQTGDLALEQMQLIQSSLDACNRLSRLNKDLVLLAKIENRQFDAKPLRIKDLIEKQLDHLEAFTQAKNLTISTQLDPEVELSMSQQLAEILVSNLLINGIKYNLQDGKINVSLSKEQLVFSNSGMPLNLDPDKIFERFKKGKHSESMGLGMAIVKSICEYYQHKIRYAYLDGMHSFIVTFDAQSA